MNKHEKKGVLNSARNEVKKAKRERAVELFLLYLTLITLALLLAVISAKLILTGYSAYIESKAGYITEVNIAEKFATSYWHGIYGLALRVSGFTEQLYDNMTNGEITRQDLFFDCVESGVVGGNEIYASLSPAIDFDSLQPSGITRIDSFTGCSGTVDCASNTFLENMSILVGTRNITGIPSTHTYRYDGQNDIFDLGILNDSDNLVYVSHIGSMQRGYNYEKIVNFQMLLPTPPNTSYRYYFFTDPYDTCPAGGEIGENINSSVYGYVKDEGGSALANASINVAGYSTLSDSQGFYNLSFLVMPGTHNLIATKSGYEPYFSAVTVNFSRYIIENNITMSLETPGRNLTINPYVYGYVFDEQGNPLSEANVSLGINSVLSNASGFYGFYATIVPGSQPIIAIKLGYNNYYAFLNLIENTTLLNHNITMSIVEEIISYPYPTGPYTTGPYITAPTAAVVAAALKKGEDYWISSKEIKIEVRQNTFVEEIIGLYNFRGSSMNLIFSLSPELRDFVKLDKTSVSISANSFSNLIVTIYGTKPLGAYNGTLKISGGIEKEIPINIKIVEKKFSIETLLMEIDLFNRIVSPGDKLKYKLNLQNLLRDQSYKIFLKISVKDMNQSKIYAEDNDEVEITNSLTLLKEIEIPAGLEEKEYLLDVQATYLNLISNVAAPFSVSKPLYLYSLLGIPVWILFAIISFFSFIFLNFLLYKKHTEKKKRYRIFLDFDSLPKPGERVAKLGKIAETNISAYYELDRLTTHTIIAGATGMGKSISAQVLIEEALLKNIAVIVFDPTAQWSGMLRKCEDKRMLAYYPKFGLKESDAKAFKGNVRQVKNARELIDISRYISPGQIQIFTLNKLDPGDIDIFIANIVRQIFKSDPQESPTLKVLLVFDEVHRLLSRFGGSGEGFLQIERACREFRKWGMGVMLISQVLSDFIGEIKANINTEIQTRTIEESDLERIKMKYGEEFLKSLVRAEVGVGMFQNAEYNKGKPYFINFRPILHNTRRLSDDELEKYNKYNEIADEIEYQIEQLEKEKVDIFDLKMELKLVKDKIMTGSFSVVEIYLEGLTPRIEKEWQKLGKKPKKREMQLVEEEEIKKSIEEAKKEREKWEKLEAAKKVEKTETKKENIEEGEKEEAKEAKPEEKVSKEKKEGGERKGKKEKTDEKGKLKEKKKWRKKN